MQIILEHQSYVLFDGDCGICTKSSEWLRNLDKAGRFIIVPYQSLAESELKKADIDYEICSKKLQVIALSGKVYQGAFAVNYIGWQFFPWKFLVAMLYLIPPFLLLEILIYWLIAKNRTKISQWLGLRACSLKH